MFFFFKKNQDSHGESGANAKALLIKRANSANKSFLSQMLETQHFAVWFHLWLAERHLRE